MTNCEEALGLPRGAPQSQTLLILVVIFVIPIIIKSSASVSQTTGIGNTVRYLPVSRRTIAGDKRLFNWPRQAIASLYLKFLTTSKVKQERMLDISAAPC